MELTSVYQSMAENSTATNINPQAFNMRLHYTLLLGQFVWVHGPYECGLWLDVKIFAIPLHVFLAQMNTSKQVMVTLVRPFLK